MHGTTNPDDRERPLFHFCQAEAWPSVFRSTGIVFRARLKPGLRHLVRLPARQAEAWPSERNSLDRHGALVLAPDVAQDVTDLAQRHLVLDAVDQDRDQVLGATGGRLE